MDAPALLTAEDFADRKYELPDGGRWTELVEGQVTAYSPVDDVHGNVVRNLSGALATHAQQTQQGYAGFELGLIVSRDPDTVRCLEGHQSHASCLLIVERRRDPQLGGKTTQLRGERSRHRQPMGLVVTPQPRSLIAGKPDR